MPDSKPTAPTSGIVDELQNIPSPQFGPPSTGNLVADSFKSAFHIGEVPCARKSLLSGIASGVGIGFIRGMSAKPIVAGNWAMGTFALVSTASWMMCVKKIEDDQKVTRQAIENLHKQLRPKKEDENESSSAEAK